MIAPTIAKVTFFSKNEKGHRSKHNTRKSYYILASLSKTTKPVMQNNQYPSGTLSCEGKI
jgi:hypothetical protein